MAQQIGFQSSVLTRYHSAFFSRRYSLCVQQDTVQGELRAYLDASGYGACYHSTGALYAWLRDKGIAVYDGDGSTIEQLPSCESKVKFTVKNAAYEESSAAAYGDFDYEFGFDSREWSCSSNDIVNPPGLVQSGYICLMVCREDSE